MGSILSRLLGLFRKFKRSKSKHMRILMVGLNNSGKTTILYRLKLAHNVLVKPTFGFNVETIRVKKTNYTIWEIGGSSHIRPLWKYYFPGTQGIIFVVDSTDRNKLDEAKSELGSIMREHELMGLPLLIFANKQDGEEAMSANEIADYLSLDDINYPTARRDVCILASWALSGINLEEGLKWIKNPAKYKVTTQESAQNSG